MKSLSLIFRKFSKKISFNQSLYKNQICKLSYIDLFKSLKSNIEEEHLFLKTSEIRKLDIGSNYFKNTLPKRKKILITLLDSYFSSLQNDEEQE